MDEEIVILPVLLPDVTKSHGVTPSFPEGTATPTILLVPPPTRELRPAHNSADAWA